MTSREYENGRKRRSRGYRESARKRMLRRRRRRILRIKRGIFCMASLVVVLLGVWVLRGMLPGGTHREVLRVSGEDLPETETESREAQEAYRAGNNIPYGSELAELEKQDSRVGQVIENAGRYPERMLKMLAKNIETLDFMLDYFDKKDLPCSETIGQAPAVGEVPLLLQWDERWGYGKYGESIVAVSGCGPTCVAMVASGLTGRNDITPNKVAAYSEENGFLTKDMDTSWDLMTYGCTEFGVTGTMLGLDENLMANTLANGCPIICSMGPGDFTENGHFIVITGYENGAFTVKDPNSRIRSERSWSYEELKDQIMNMWYYIAEE